MQELKVSINVKDVLPESVALGVGAMLSQRDKGVDKYGQSIEEADLSAGELAEHALQEAADGLVYGVMLAKKVHELEVKLVKLQNRFVRVHEAALHVPRSDATDKLLVAIAATDVPLMSAREQRLEEALRAIQREVRTITLGSPTEQLVNINHITHEALK